MPGSRAGRALPGTLEIEFAYDGSRTTWAPAGRSMRRKSESVRQELWADLAVHHAIRQFAHAAALARPSSGHRPCLLPEGASASSAAASRLSSEGTAAKLARSFTEANREARARLLPGPAQPGLSARDQGTEPLARAEDPRQTGAAGPARPVGPQPDLEAEEHPPGRSASPQRIAFS